MTTEQKQREIKKREAALDSPKPHGYIAYMILIICLVYITDEIASSICTQMKTEIADDLFARFGESSVGRLELLSIISYPFMAISLFYRTLSDRFGRKPFLIINTLGMGLGMFIVFATQSIWGYIIGYSVISFFVPHDMQVVYIMETAPAEKRARVYSIIKCLSTLGVMLIPLLRRVLMPETSMWRRVFFIPAVIGLVSSLLALVLSRETDSFLNARLRYLRLSDEELARERAEKDLSNSQGGFFTAFRYAIHDEQLRRLYFLMGFFNLGFIITMYYQVILSYGYAEHMVAAGLTASLGSALETVSTGAVTDALFLFPVGSALIQLIQGFISDRTGRKRASVIMAACVVLSFIGFSAGARMGMNAGIIGFLTGVCIGSFWAFGDINVMMMSESAPTNLRSSILSSSYVTAAIGTFVGMGILIPLMNILGNSVTAVATMAIALPGFAVAIVLLSKTRETRGSDLDA